MSQKQFGEHTPALEVIEGINLTGYEVIVTGANSGIGVETLRALAQAGARCILCARDTEKARTVANDIIKTSGNQNIEIEQLELDSLDSVNSFVERFLAKNRPLNILVNNAGIMACPKSYTRDGFEMQFGTNHLGHFALTVGLLPALKAGYKVVGKKSRVINVSSIAHAVSDVDFNDINFRTRDYDDFVSYGQSKTCNILFSVELTRRYAEQGVVSNALMPGAIMTNLQKHMNKDDWIKKGWMDENGNILFNLKTIEAGASTSVWAAVAPELEGVGGLYLENCVVSKENANVQDIFAKMFGYMPYALNKSNAEKLWILSEEFIQKI